MSAPMSPYAGLVTRLGALAVDSVLLAIAVPVLANGPASVWTALAGQAPGWLKLGAQVLAAALPAVYFAVCWWGSGQTAGGMLFGAVVCRHGGGRIGFGRALLRSVVGLLLPVLWLAGLVGILVSRERRALHDRVFGTVVLRKLAAVRAPAVAARVPAAAAVPTTTAALKTAAVTAPAPGAAAVPAPGAAAVAAPGRMP